MANTGNDNLRHALASAGISGDELADLLRVDPRTVRRWLTGQPPYPRHRQKIARALELTEHDLWPDLTPPATRTNGQVLPAETITAYAHLDDPDAPTTVTLISSATERIELLDETLHPLLSQAGVPELLISKASQGCSIRILVELPVPCLAPLLNQPGIEIYAIENGWPLAIHRADQQMLIILQPDGLPDERPVLLHLTRQAAGRVFDRLAQHYESTWDTAIEPIETEGDIDRYLFEDEPEETRRGGDHDQPDEAQPPRAVNEQPPPLRRPTATQTPRRWPRRPSTVD
jgi:transcriptional regulator with XRE-family HTH domain